MYMSTIQQTVHFEDAVLIESLFFYYFIIGIVSKMFGLHLLTLKPDFLLQNTK